MEIEKIDKEIISLEDKIKLLEESLISYRKIYGEIYSNIEKLYYYKQKRVRLNEMRRRKFEKILKNKT